MYCSGLRPEHPGSLEVCVEQLGVGPRYCQTFDTWPGLVAAIPACDAEEPPDEPAPVLACTDYLDQGACVTNGCIWDKGPPDGLEHCYEPPGP
jgi:hypothetical protein